MPSVSSLPGPETDSDVATSKHSDGSKNSATCPEGMTPRLMGDKHLCLEWSEDRSRIQVWLHDDTKLICLGIARRLHRGWWETLRPSGLQVAGYNSLREGLRRLASTPLE